jgi:hypothetical protein
MEKIKSTGIMDLVTGERYYTKGWSLNCHTCGTTYSPLRVNFIPLDFYQYRHGYYNRFILLELLDKTVNINCGNCTRRIINQYTGEPYEEDSTVLIISTTLDTIEGRIDPMMRMKFDDDDRLNDKEYWEKNKDAIREQVEKFIYKWYSNKVYIIR